MSISLALTSLLSKMPKTHWTDTMQQSYAIRYLPHFDKWQVLGYGISIQTMYLRVDGTWQHIMASGWNPDGGSLFSTRNEAEIALAKTSMTDHTESLTAENKLCQRKKV